ncbi:MAG: biopolymer transporter ExbD [Verrucomicrobia bacterium]|nr:biopolymer transporter ExbD [Verrucomicrobiota bacterium]
MRRFSQRSHLVTLAEINLTPLMDLAFVLLIIFVITTPLLEQGMNLSLPIGGQPDTRKVDPRDIRTVEVSSRGTYMMSGYSLTLDQIATWLIHDARRNPNLIVDVRGDEMAPYKFVAAIFDRLEQAGIGNVSLRTQPPKP